MGTVERSILSRYIGVTDSDRYQECNYPLLREKGSKRIKEGSEELSNQPALGQKFDQSRTDFVGSVSREIISTINREQLRRYFSKLHPKFSEKRAPHSTNLKVIRSQNYFTSIFFEKWIAGWFMCCRSEQTTFFREINCRLDRKLVGKMKDNNHPMIRIRALISDMIFFSHKFLIFNAYYV